MERTKLPNSTAALVLGILSIITCCCYGVIGLPLGIIALVLGNKAMKIYHEAPENFKGEGNAKIGRILGIVGIVINVIFIGYLIWVISLIGWDALQDPQLLQQRLLELQ